MTFQVVLMSSIAYSENDCSRFAYDMLVDDSDYGVDGSGTTNYDIGGNVVISEYSVINVLIGLICLTCYCIIIESVYYCNIVMVIMFF